MIVNGKKENFDSITIKELLEYYKISKDTVVVEVNKEIIQKGYYEHYILNDSDKIEIVRFVGGG